MAQHTYPRENNPLAENFKTEVFVNVIREPDIELAICSAQNPTFSDTPALALAQETTCTISRPQVIRVRKMEVVEKEEFLNKFKEMMKQVLE